MSKPFFRTTAWAVRDAATKQRVSYRYFARAGAAEELLTRSLRGENVELFRTSHERPICFRRKREA